MTDDLPSYEELENYLDHTPKTILDRLPDCIASRRAKQLQDQVFQYSKEAREKAPRPPALSVGEDGRLEWQDCVD